MHAEHLWHAGVALEYDPEVLLFPHLGINQNVLLQGVGGGVGGGSGGELTIREEDKDLWRHFSYFSPEFPDFSPVEDSRSVA